MSFAEVVKAFMEIGILGVCSVLMIVTYYENHKRSHKTDNDKNELIVNSFNNLNDKMDHMLNTITTQNDKLISAQEQQANTLITGLLNKVIHHTPSAEESDKLFNVNKSIDNILQDVLLETNASRACLVQYHNGGIGMSKQAFLKMSITNEKSQLGIKSIMNECKDQFRSVLGYIVNEINSTGHCCIFDIDDIKSVDIGTYELMLTRGIQAKCGYGLHNANGMLIGYITVEFEDKKLAKKEIIRNSFKEHYREIERLLNS